jgi:hypothetical protein
VTTILTLESGTSRNRARSFSSCCRLIRQPKRIGVQVFTALDQRDANPHREWLATTSIVGAEKINVSALAAQTSMPAEFLQKARGVVGAGTTLILSDLGVARDPK